MSSSTTELTVTKNIDNFFQARYFQFRVKPLIRTVGKMVESHESAKVKYFKNW